MKDLTRTLFGRLALVLFALCFGIAGGSLSTRSSAAPAVLPPTIVAETAGPTPTQVSETAAPQATPYTGRRTPTIVAETAAPVAP